MVYLVKMKKYILSFGMVAIFGTLILIFGYIDKEVQIKVKDSFDSSFFRDVEFLQKKDGQVKLQVFAKEALMSDDDRKMDIKYLTMFFPEREFTVKSQRGVYYLESGDIFLTDGVEGFSKDYKIYGKEAYWNAKEKTLYSDKPLKIVSSKFSIEGNSGKASADLIELKKGVTAFVYSK